MNTGIEALPPDAPGWYLDADADIWRWSDGSNWTKATRTLTDKRLRPILSLQSLRFDRWVRGGAAIGLVITGVIGIIAVISGRAVLDAAVLLLLGLPFVLVFQLWLLSVMRARYPTRRELGLGARASWRTPNLFSFFFRAIRPAAMVALVVTIVVAWLIALTGFIGTDGVAEKGSGACPYRINNHGDITCVSHSTYERARSKEERATAGILSAFFAVHLAGSAGELNRRRREGPSPTALIP